MVQEKELMVSASLAVWLCVLILIMEQDKKIREDYYRKDKDFNDKIRLEMEEEESMLKSYFK